MPPFGCDWMQAGAGPERLAQICVTRQLLVPFTNLFIIGEEEHLIDSNASDTKEEMSVSGVFEDQNLDSLHVNKVIQNVVQSPGDSHIVTSVPVLVEFSVGSVIYESTALIDDGADLSILGSNHLSRFLVPDSEKLSSDIKITLADGETTSNVLFGFYSDIVLHTAAGPLMIRKTMFLFR